MATFGQGINPQFGAIDYSPILKGSVAGAEMAAKGGQMIGQGLANLGQEVGKGIATYQLNKKIVADAIGEIEGAAQNPAVLKYLTNEANKGTAAKLFKKLGTTGTLSINDATTLSGSVRSFMAQQAITDKLEQQRQELEIQRGNMEANQMGASAQYATATRGKPTGIPMTLQQISDLRNQGQDLTYTMGPNGEFMVTGGSTFAPPPPGVVVNNSLGNKMKDTRFNDLSKLRDTDITTILSADPAVTAMEGLLEGVDDKGQVMTGFFAKVKLPVQSFFNSVGITDDKDVGATQEYLASRITIMAQAIKAFGAGTGLSDNDAKLVDIAAAGNISNERSALKRIISLYRKTTESKIENYNQSVRQAFGGKSEEDKWAYNTLLVNRDANAALFDKYGLTPNPNK